jgi:L-cysteine:1D-myo-inositol 2-amino-2-deoxy-alpha-D-glucopyranoside ligase
MLARIGQDIEDHRWMGGDDAFDAGDAGHSAVWHSDAASYRDGMDAWAAPAVPTVAGRPVPLRMHDTATDAVQPAMPAGGTAGLYVCGITPYDATHLGHAATYLAFDLVQRVWHDNGVAVRYVQNVTDIDDPLLERAAATGEQWDRLAARETDLYRKDMAALRVLPPDDYLGAVEEIPQIAAAVDELQATSAAYRVADDVYFRIAADPKFGSVTGLHRAEMLALFAERGGDPERPGKEDPLDSLLWRAARTGEPSWSSPLGPGRPGWHIECSVIAHNRLGMGFLVQGGGSDLAFPHHEHSASHARVLTGEATFAQLYVHAGMIELDGEKMSKARGNLVFVSKLRGAGVDPMAIRLALLDGHYRADREWTGGRLGAAERRLARWRAAAAKNAADPARALAALREALSNDLDTSSALTAVDGWADATHAGAGAQPEAGPAMAGALDALLGVAL